MPPRQSLQQSRTFGSWLRVAVATVLLLLLPSLAMQFTDEVDWDLADFAVAGLLLFGAGLTYEWIAGRARSVAYRAAVGIAVTSGLLLVWANLAVGIIGNEGNIANAMYSGVLAVAAIGALIARFRPHGMARALFATALAQMLVAAIAIAARLGSGAPNWPWDVLIATAVFATLWSGSAVLFLRASVMNLAPRGSSRSAARPEEVSVDRRAVGG